MAHGAHVSSSLIGTKYLGLGIHTAHWQLASKAKGRARHGRVGIGRLMARSLPFSAFTSAEQDLF